MRRLVRGWLDVPPLWLLGALMLARALGAAVPEPSAGRWGLALGAALALAGVALVFAAAWQFRRARTTIVPHRVPEAMITAGVFGWSRNPIYLADLLILTGAVLYWGPLLPLLTVPLLAWILRARFILPEEARMRDAFGEAFAAYAARVRRWL